MDIERHYLFGVGVDAVDMDAVEHSVDETIYAGGSTTIFAVNPEKIMAAERDSALREALNGAELLIPDGIGVVLAARRAGVNLRQRVPGSELMPRLCALAARRGYRVFLFGAREDVNALAAKRLTDSYPGLVIAGRHHGYVGEDDTAALIAEINAARPQMLFVALGSPKQERWTAAHRSELNVAVIQGVGGTFDVIAGTVKRAPPLWIRLNLEWLYRLLASPRRLPRHAALLRFAWRMLIERAAASAVAGRD